LLFFQHVEQYCAVFQPSAKSLYISRILLFSVLICGGVIQIRAAPPNYFVRTWQAEQGLPQNKVMAVVQTRDGYLWAGTYSGLARFDGVHFSVFDDSNTPELRNSRVTSLFETRDGTLWIGDESGQVTQYKNGRFEAVEFHPAWNSGKIYDMGADESGDIWLLNEFGQLARLRDGLVLTPEAGVAANLVGMTRSADGKIWVARDGRVSVLEHGQLHPLQFAEAMTNTYVLGIGASADGGLWVTDDQRIRKWMGGKWVTDLGAPPWASNAVTRLTETKNGVLMVGTVDRGLYLITLNPAEKLVHFDHVGNLPSGWVTALCEDLEGNIWVGTGSGGIAMLRTSPIESVAPPDQWQGRAVLSVCPGGNGALWIGTEGAGLYRYQDEEWTNFNLVQGIRNPYIWSLAEDEAGRLWVGTWGGGLFLQEGDHFDFAPGLWGVIPPMPALLEGSHGSLWVGTAIGLLQYQDGKTNWYEQDAGQALRDVRTVAEDGQGAVWFGMAGGGLACLKDGNIQRFRTSDGLSSEFIECLHFDKEDALWIGTFGGGLDRFKNGRFAVINRKQGLPNSVIGDIEEDGRGFFWMSSHNGIIRVSEEELNRCAEGKTDELHCETYGINDGLPTIECSEGLQPAGCKTVDGRLWFPTSKGLVAINPLDVGFNPLPPPVVIEKMQVDERPLMVEQSSSKLLTVPPGRHRFEFQYTGLSFVDPEKVQFQYRMDGLEKDWVNAGTKRTANYNYIPPGNYTFEVIACNNDGIWNKTGADIHFKVLPYFWQTLSFQILVGIVIVAASGGLVWFGTQRRMQRKLERLEWQRAVEHERARIAHDIHDDLGSHLTRIAMLSESARGELDDPEQAIIGLNKIYDTVRELTRAMDEIVWAVNPRHDNLEGLTSYLEKFAQDWLALAGIRCRLDIPEQFQEWQLTAEVRHNLFLAFKEALNNVVKHSGASEVHIGLIINKTTFELSVRDNGCGFSAKSKLQNLSESSVHNSSGNGLENMLRRLSGIGGSCNIQSVPAQGTQVIFTVPLNIFKA
jgi:signal transduction histidine kinase/ligand-binding sensor domain-containing protein